AKRVHAGGEVARKTRAVLRVRLERDLDVRRKWKHLRGAVDHRADRLRREQGRRAAAEKDCFQAPAAPAVRTGIVGEPAHNRVPVLALGNFFNDPDVEVAIRAFEGAIGNVNVERERCLSRSHQALFYFQSPPRATSVSGVKTLFEIPPPRCYIQLVFQVFFTCRSTSTRKKARRASAASS